MLSVARALPYRSGGVLWPAAIVGAPLLLGAAAATGYSLRAAELLALGLAVLVGMHNWRWAVYGLLAYLPFSGIAIVLSYPNTSEAVLVKDFLFVLPAYAGFLAYSIAHRSRLGFDGAPVALFLLLGLIVLLQALNPDLPNRLVPAIGVKVWLLYVPLYFLGYHLVRDRSELFRLLGLMSAVAVVPALLGVVEAALIYAGRADRVYALYGDAAAAVTQNFAEFSYSGGAPLRRVPSTFSFVTQYYAFITTMVAVTYAWWRGRLRGRRSGLAGAAVWMLALVAAFLSGARVAFLLVPVLVGLILLLEGRGLRVPWGRLAAPAIAFLATVAALGASGNRLIAQTIATAQAEFGDIFVHGFHRALSTTVLGLGTGVDTNASRYAFSEPALFQGVGGTWYESWLVKVVLELGIPGLIVVALLLGTIVGRGLREHARLSDPSLRVVSAAILAFLIWSLLSATKGQYLDFDPVNVYFWLLAGVLARVAVLDRLERERRSS